MESSQKHIKYCHYFSQFTFRILRFVYIMSVRTLKFRVQKSKFVSFS